MSACFEETEKFIEEKIEEIVFKKKYLLKMLFIYFLHNLFLVLWYVVSLPLPLKIVVYCAKKLRRNDKAKQRFFYLKVFDGGTYHFC